MTAACWLWTAPVRAQAGFACSSSLSCAAASQAPVKSEIAQYNGSQLLTMREVRMTTSCSPASPPLSHAGRLCTIPAIRAAAPDLLPAPALC